MNRAQAWRSFFVIAALLAAGLVAPPTASAQSDAQKKEAKEHYDKATRFYDVGRYGDAIDEYQKVYLLVSDPILLYNIGQAYRLWDKPDEAVRFYRNYLRRSPSADNRADVEKKIADLEKVIEERKRTGPAAPPPVTAPPPVETVPPPTTTAPPPPPATAPPVTAPPPAGTVTQPAAPSEPPPRSGKRTAAFALMIGGGALVVTSIITGSLAAQKAKDVQKAANNHEAFDPSVEKSGKSLNTITALTAIPGLVAAGVGAVLLLTDHSTETRAAAAPARTKLSLFPLAGPQVAGAGASLTF
jgi:tetratricopeptide (TPR) repeat protein